MFLDNTPEMRLAEVTKRKHVVIDHSKFTERLLRDAESKREVELKREDTKQQELEVLKLELELKREDTRQQELEVRKLELQLEMAKLQARDL